jgi:uncharacterized protein (TIGR02466 family)
MNSRRSFAGNSSSRIFLCTLFISKKIAAETPMADGAQRPLVALDMTRLVTTGEGQRKINLQMDCWANVSRRGQYNSVHDHAGATWSGVYYVSGGEPDNDDPLNGKLELLDPRIGVNVFGGEEGLFGGRYFVEPMPGLMVIFPGWLKHMVHPFTGSGERISISFNVNVQFQQQTR